jgi:putative MATE family efflux protein
MVCRTMADDASLWRTLVLAFRGSPGEDFTRGSIPRALLLLAVPMVTEMIMESVFALVDVFFVSKLGADAVAAVGITESLITIVYAVAMGLSVAATAKVSRRTGEGDGDGAARAAVQVIVLCIAVSIVMGAGGVLFARRLLALLGASDEARRLGGTYATLMLGANMPIVLIYGMNAIFRGAGDAVTAMRTLWLANILNIVLCPCFIFGVGPIPALGVTGAAVATVVGRSVGVAYQFSVLVRGSKRMRVRRSHLAVDPKEMIDVLRLAASAIVQVLIATASWVALTRLMTPFGSAAVAGHTIGIRFIIFALLPSMGLGNAAATLVGQSLGAQKPDRAERSVWVACFYNMLFLGSVGAVLLLWTEPIVRLLTHDESVVPYAVACLRIVSYGFLFYAYGVILEQAFNGAGDTFTPTVLNFICYWAFQVPLAYVLSRTFGMGPRGIFWSITASFSLMPLLSGFLFHRGKWKTKTV